MIYDELITEWMDSRIAIGDVMECTARKGAQVARNLNALRCIDIDEISKLDVIKAAGELKKRVSNETVRKSMKAGKQVMRWARLMGLTENDPFDGVPLPKKIQPERRSLDQEEASRLFVELNNDDSDIALAAKTALLTGMRIGEVLALKGSDISGTTINLQRSIKNDKSIGEPKTEAGIRKISIPQELSEQLKSRGDDFIFDSSYNSFEHAWSKWRKEHGFDGLKFHELRHTHATLLIANGVDIKTVQHRLGHSSSSITMDVYAHALPCKDEEASGKIFSIVGGDNK